MSKENKDNFGEILNREVDKTMIEIAAETVRGVKECIEKESDTNRYKSKMVDNLNKPSEFKKADVGNLQWSLMPFEQLEDVVRVLMNGSEKYGRENWRKCDDISRYKDALMRHVISYVEGVPNDPEDNLSHLAHAVCNCLFLMALDRPVLEARGPFIPIKD